MTRWNGWTSDLEESAAVFGTFYPDRAAAMTAAARAARAGGADALLLHELLEDLGPWLATEYAAVHGRRTPRPDVVR